VYYFTGLLAVIGIGFYVNCLYLIYRFKQISERFKSPNAMSRMMQNLEEHERVVKMVHKFNKPVGSVTFGIMYFIYTPMADLTLNVATFNYFHVYLRIFAALMFGIYLLSIY